MSTRDFNNEPEHLGANDIHTWTVNLNVEPSAVTEAERTLAATERVRADRFRFPRDRRSYIVSRGSLRRILARYLDVAAQALIFEYNEHGKPRLGYDSAPSKIEFNLSHAGDVALIVLGRERLVGVDIESLDREVDHAEIAKRYFAPAEATPLDLLPPDRQLPAFLRLWTVKEAYLKALGLGLSGGMSKLVVPPTKWEYKDPFPLMDKTGKVWTLNPLRVPDGYVASVAVEGTDVRIVQRDWKQ